MNSKVHFIQLFGDLFMRGEMLKAEQLLLNCVPLDIVDDPDIAAVKEEAFNRLAELRRWNKEGRPYSDAHANLNDYPKFGFAVSKIRKLKGIKRSLDVGCYTGDFVRQLADDGIDAWGVDIHKELIEKLEKDNKRPSVHFRFCQAENLVNLFGEDFELVTAFDVLEHCFDFETAVRAIENVTKKGGTIMINLPRMTLGYKDEAFEHLRMFSENYLNSFFGDRKKYKMETCQDELGRDTSFITYQK